MMKLEQKIINCIDQTEYLKQYVYGFDIIYSDHEINLFTKEISDAEIKYDLQDETDYLEEQVGFTITIVEDIDSKSKSFVFNYPANH